MEAIIIIGVLFVGYHFLKLSQRFFKNPFIYIGIGILVLLLSYYISTLVMIMFLNIGLKFPYSNTIIINCFSIPFAVFISGITYKGFERKFKKENKINEIGKD
ncbi:hypothetical protein [Tenacibaculum sp. 190524A05c]|uniref:hypothetical protein n=1 Tax=Tenacibaculum platacis TaxID=3137852 RepID=UPI0032B0F262